ncbi:MAG TPA: SOS response-associated peptidase [Verrucomicrobiae bacterium]|nr:SOS response-associated peptidase [Verrucomicrobiae bacterium]
MCNNISIKTPNYQLLERQTSLQFPPEHRELYKSYYEVSGFNKPLLPVVSTEAPRELRMYRWSFLPGWVKDPATFKANTLNARAEELFEKPTYRSYWRNRCLLVTTGFFEPHEVDYRKQNESWHVRPKEGEIMYLGCVWSRWGDTNTFSIVTTEASPLMAHVHNGKNRMPLILDDEKAEAWLLPDLTKEEMAKLMETPQLDHTLEAYRVMDGVTNTRLDTNVPEVLVPLQNL